MDDTQRRLKAKLPGADTGIEVRKSVCAICDPTTQCGLDLSVRDGRIVKVEGSRENPHNRGSLCAKGAATRQYVYHEDRLLTPLRRTGPRGSGEFAPISWDEALEEVAANLERVRAESGAESAVFYVGYPKQLRPFVQRLALQYGSPNFCTESSACFTATVMAFKLLYGQMAGPDLRNTRCLLVWSANPFHANTPPPATSWTRSTAASSWSSSTRGARSSPPRRDLHLQPLPGTDGALALGVAHVILEEGLHDAAFVRRAHQGVRGVPRLRAAVRPGAGRGHHRGPGGEDPRGRQALRDDQAGGAHVQRRPRGPPRERRAERARRVRAHRPHRQLRRRRRQQGRRRSAGWRSAAAASSPGSASSSCRARGTTSRRASAPAASPSGPSSSTRRRRWTCRGRSAPATRIPCGRWSPSASTTACSPTRTASSRPSRSSTSSATWTCSPPTRRATPTSCCRPAAPWSAARCAATRRST